MVQKQGLGFAAVLVVLAGLLFGGCGSGSSGASESTASERQAAGMEYWSVCIGDRPWDRINGAIVTFFEREDEIGRYPLDGNWCRVGFSLGGVIDFPDGTRLAAFSLSPFGQEAVVNCADGSRLWQPLYPPVDSQTTHICGGFKLTVIREPDSRTPEGDKQREFQVWVARA